jgi:hypothetical protein
VCCTLVLCSWTPRPASKSSSEWSPRPLTYHILSQLCEKIANQANICQNYIKLSKVIQSSRSIWLIRIVPKLQAECAQVRPQRQYLRTSLVESWYEPSRQVFDWLHHVAPCCTHHFHAAVALAVRVLMQTGNWSSQCLYPELEYTYYLLRLVFLTRGFMIFSAEVSARFYIVWTMSRHLCQKDRNSVRPISRQLKSFLWQGLLWMTQSHCMYEKADHSLLHNVCIVSR